MKRSEVEEERDMLKRSGYYRRIFESYIFKRKVNNLSFWHTDLKANKLSEEDRRGVELYPMNFAEKTKYNEHRDSDDVIMLNYGGNIGVQYNPNAIAQVALGFYDLYLDSLKSRNKGLQDLYSYSVLIQAKWFVNHGRKVKDNVLLWEYDFPFEMRNYLYPPWRSALAQGQGISVCLRAYKLSKEEQYLNAAKRAFKSFRHLAREHPGGVLDDSEGYTWLEEYIVEPTNHVLNGSIWALWGVRDYAIFTDDNYAWELWHSCVKTLRENLGHYDLGFWTTYDLVKFNPGKQPTMPSSLYYQNLHVVQMQAMYHLTLDPVFKHFEKKWNSQLVNRTNRIVSQIWKTYFKLRWF